MKKIVTLIAAMLLAASFSAQAQLKITGEGEAPQKVATLNPSTHWIYLVGEHYVIYATSPHRFDPYFVLDLGTDKETARQTAKELLEALTAAKNGDQLHVESMGDKLLLTKDTMMGHRWMISTVDTRQVYAGVAMVDAAMLRKAVKVLQ